MVATPALAASAGGSSRHGNQAGGPEIFRSTPHASLGAPTFPPGFTDTAVEAGFAAIAAGRRDDCQYFVDRIH